MKTNLSFFVSLFVAILSSTTMAQWESQIAPGLPNYSDPQVLFSVVDDSVCWGFSLLTAQFLKTTNGGDNWTVSTVTNASGLQGQGMSALDVNTAWIAMRDPSLVTSGGIFKTTDGGNTWNKQTTAFQGSGGIPRVIHFFDTNNGLCVGDPRNNEFEIYTTTNGGNNWILVPGSNIPTPNPFNERAAPQVSAQGIGNYFWFQTFSHAIFRTTDRGYTWTVTRDVINIDGAVSFAFKDTLNGLACTFVGGNKLSRTTNGGETWIPLTLDPDLANLSTFFIAYAKGTAGAYVITSHNNYNGINPAIPGSAYTLNDGISWVYINNTTLGAARFYDWNTGWAGGINDAIWLWNSDILPVELVSFSANAIGNEIRLSWQTATEINNHGFEIYRNGNKIAFVEGKGTTTEKQDYSFVDKNLQAGIYNYRLNQLDFDGTQEVVGELTVYLTLPEQFSLEQNYPNPFNPSTTLQFSIPEQSFVKLEIFNSLGEKITTLVSEELNAGKYKFDWNAAGYTSGVYYYKLIANDFSQTRKLVLLK